MDVSSNYGSHWIVIQVLERCVGLHLKPMFDSQLIFHSLTLGIFEILVLTTLYPFMKRITHWPQAWLGEWRFIINHVMAKLTPVVQCLIHCPGIAFSWGAIISWVASSPVDWSVMSLLLFTGCRHVVFYASELLRCLTDYVYQAGPFSTIPFMP